MLDCPWGYTCLAVCGAVWMAHSDRWSRPLITMGTMSWILVAGLYLGGLRSLKALQQLLITHIVVRLSPSGLWCCHGPAPLSGMHGSSSTARPLWQDLPPTAAPLCTKSMLFGGSLVSLCRLYHCYRHLCIVHAIW